MQKRLSIVTLVLFSLFLLGCPYESDVPIDQPSVKYPANLLGKWEPKSSSDELMLISRKNDFLIKIVKTKKEPKEDEKPQEYEGYLSDVAGTKFLNLYELKDESYGTKKYYLYKIELSSSGARITLSPLTENIDEKFNNPADLKSFIQKNKDLSFFYHKEDDVYIRAD